MGRDSLTRIDRNGTTDEVNDEVIIPSTHRLGMRRSSDAAKTLNGKISGHTRQIGIISTFRVYL